MAMNEKNDWILERDKKAYEKKRKFFNDAACQYEYPGPFKKFYYKRMKQLVGFLIPPGSKVLDIGCGMGDLLNACKPSKGVGVDFSDEIIKKAQERYPDLEFIVADAHSFKTKKKFDYILVSNLVGDLLDIIQVFKQIRLLSHEKTRVIITHYNYLWAPFVKIAEYLNLKPRQREQNWLEIQDLKNLLNLADIETIKHGRDMLLPVSVPVISDLVNDAIGKLPVFNRFCVNEFVVGRPQKAVKSKERKQYYVSVIVACKDEKGNIEEIFKKIPKMGKGTELIFVDGHSVDGTCEKISECIERKKELNPLLDSARVFMQPGKGKGDAVRLGFEEAEGDILMILDADITVRPEELTKFYDALADGKGDFINGSRLMYPMEKEAMRFLNMLANHLFSWTFSWLLDQRLTDTLCGTKVLFKKDYERIKKHRSFFGDFDPFGDFDLLFGAAKLNLKIAEIPIRYRNRDYGEIKISRFKHGLLLAKMSCIAFKRFKLLKKAEGSEPSTW